MKAVVTIAPKQSVIKEVPNPVMDDDSVKIKLKYCGVCHSERYDWLHHAGAYGHEPMGIIVEVGKNVKGLTVGDRVSGLWGSNMPGTGGMVEYAVANVRQSTIIKLPDQIRDEDLVVEPLACLLSAVSKAKCSMPGTKVCVVGCGYMGCGAISLLKLRGCYVVAVDIRESSLRDALAYGADEALTPDEALNRYVRDSDGNCPIEAGFECVMEWAETNESLDLAIQLTKMCGQLCVGAYHTGPQREVNVQLLGVKAIDMHHTHPRENDLLITGAIHSVEMLDRGAWNFKNIPTMVYPMNQFDRAMTEMETKYGHHLKALINMEMADGEPYLV
ncbi:MAG: alcohol dehydrogenase catalytic domain-containing protein [Clostridia bacterium]|nr:alcohol dehydrogenase catalytic domain-containing protein [Clostridia bacterium]